MVPRASPVPAKEEMECAVEMVEMNQPHSASAAELPQIHHARAHYKVLHPGRDPGGKSGAGGANSAHSLNGQRADSTPSQRAPEMQNGHVMMVGNSLSAGSVTGAGINLDEDDEEETDSGDVSSTRPLLGRREEEEGEEEEEEGEGEVEERLMVEEEEQETCMTILLQMLLPYLIAGFGMVGAGMVLDVVQHSAVFVEVTELFILVPALLGLKGNLEMTLASRLSTQANLGTMDTWREKLKMIMGNMALIQVQAIVVAFLASMFAMAVGWIPKGEFKLNHALLLCASSIFTASVASFVLGKHTWLLPAIIAFFFLLLPLWVVCAVRNKYTGDIIFSGWIPVVCAMIISSLGGYILDFAVTVYHGIAVFQPVINGVGGNLVAVHASRISTYLHCRGSPGRLPTGTHKGCANPCTFFFGKDMKARAVRVLLLLVIPGHLIFIYTIYYMKAGHTSITLLFNLFYLLAALLQVIILLYVSQWLVHLIWSKGRDPDNEVIPYLTALGDLLGTGFLALAFHALYLIGDRDADLGE